jgi:hypothetical protein
VADPSYPETAEAVTVVVWVGSLTGHSWNCSVITVAEVSCDRPSSLTPPRRPLPAQRKVGEFTSAEHD